MHVRRKCLNRAKVLLLVCNKTNSRNSYQLNGHKHCSRRKTLKNYLSKFDLRLPRARQNICRFQETRVSLKVELSLARQKSQLFFSAWRKRASERVWDCSCRHNEIVKQRRCSKLTLQVSCCFICSYWFHKSCSTVTCYSSAAACFSPNMLRGVCIFRVACQV